MSDASGYLCPSCQSPLEHAGGAANLLRCPNCGQQCFAPAEAEGARPDPDDRPAEDVSPDAQASRELLNAKRIRSVALARRAAYRARSWCIIAAVVCAAIIVQLIWMIVQAARHRGWGLQCTGYLIFAILAAAGTIYFAARAQALSRQARQPANSIDRGFESVSPPDFSTLDNGSKQAKNLEDVK